MVTFLPFHLNETLQFYFKKKATYDVFHKRINQKNRVEDLVSKMLPNGKCVKMKYHYFLNY